VRDHAVITVGGAQAFGGTVKFFLCGPLASTNTTNCSTGGVQIGTPAIGETVTGSAGSATLNSDTATLTAAGRYCWRAEYSGDSAVGVPPSTDPSKAVADGGTTSECFTLAPLTPQLPTTATSSVLLGTAIDDTAALSGTANQPATNGIGPGNTIVVAPTVGNGAAAGGSITFSLYGPSATPVCTTAIATRVVTVNGDGSYSASSGTGTGSLTPSAVGTYYWIADYNPDSSGNTVDPTTASCGATGEVTVITGAASLATTQNWLPNDTAHITSPAGTTLSGTVTFTLYNDGSCGTGGGTAQYTSGALAIPGTSTGTANDRTITTANTSFKVTTLNDAVAWSWKVSYNDANLQDPSDVCETTTPAFTLSD
jgi:hypothetical protein